MRLALFKSIFHINDQPHVLSGAWGNAIFTTISTTKGRKSHLKQISKAEFAWLYEKYFRKFKYKNWTKTCVAKGRSKRGKYYVEDKWYHTVKKQNIV